METRRKLSEAKKWKSSPMKWKKHTEESKEKNRIAHLWKPSKRKWKKVPEDKKQNYGHKHTEETKKLLSEKWKWRKARNKGKKLWPSWNKGKSHSEEHKKNLSKNSARRWDTPWNKWKPFGAVRWENNPMWKWWITPENQRIRGSLEYSLRRKACFERDNFTCQKCGQNGGYLHAHHINNFADFHELRLAIDNGITLCKECHKQFHNIYGKRNNTKEQLVEFIT